MHRRFKAAGLALVVALGGLALSACADNPAHCDSSAYSGDNVVTDTGETIPAPYHGGGLSTNETTDPYGTSTTDHTAIDAPISGASQSSPKYAAYLETGYLHDCFVHFFIRAWSTDKSYSQSANGYNAVRVSEPSFTLRNSTVEAYHDVSGSSPGAQGGDAIHIANGSDWKGTDLGLYRDNIVAGNSCIVHETTGDVSITSSRLACEGYAFTGTAGTGSNQGYVLSGNFIGANLGFFDQAPGHEGASIVSGNWFEAGGGYTTQATAIYLATVGTFDPPPTATTDYCTNNTVNWPYNSAAPVHLVNAWNAKCANTTFVDDRSTPSGTAIVRSQWSAAIGTDGYGYASQLCATHASATCN